jgi:hypothetical protein
VHSTTYGCEMDVAEVTKSRWTKSLGSLRSDARLFARTLRDRSHATSELFVVGDPGCEPWHFAAHMTDEAILNGRRDLVPTLLRWTVPPGAPSHLSVSVDEMLRISSNRTILVINPVDSAFPELLERVHVAKKRGSRIMTLHRGDAELVDLSHETLAVNASRPIREFDFAQHVITDMTPEASRHRWHHLHRG